MKKMMVYKLVLIVVALFLVAPAVNGGDRILTMSTTTSTQASGLLDILLPAFEKDTGIKVKVIAKGTGAAIRDGRDGNVDLIFVHAKAREEAFIKEGYGTKRYAVMHNDFIIIGPKKDPAGIKGIKTASEALKKIAATGSGFVSRGDDSGTHTKEQALWKAAGVDLTTITTVIVKKGKKKEVKYSRPNGKWYISLGQGMGKTLTFTDEKQVYTMTDRGTYIKYRYGNKQGIDLPVLCQGDPELSNPYGVIPVNPAKFPHVNYQLAEKFAYWLVSSKGQSLIDGYRLIGQQLFYPDAIK